MSFNTFASGTKILSAKLNENFSKIVDGSEVNNVAWDSWVPVFSGFSVDPTVTARYTQIGKTVIVELITSAAGTSNATNFTITLPVAPKYAVSFACGVAQDGGSYTAYPSRLQCAAGSTTATLYKLMDTTAWSATGGKYCDFVITYETA